MIRGGHPTLLASAGLTLRRRRWLETPGEVHVRVGDRVAPRTVIARAHPTGALVAVNVAYQLDIAPAAVPGAMTRPIGAAVERHEEIACLRSLGGLFRSRCRAPVAGILREISAPTGQVLIETAAPAREVHAALAGEVVAVSPRRGADVVGRATVVQGIVGVGGEVWGELTVVVDRPTDVVTAAVVGPELRGRVVLGGALVTGNALQRATEVGVAALITGGIEDRDLTALLGRELAVAVTGRERVQPVLIITGGFGRIPQDPVAFTLLRERAGRGVWACGITRVRAGARRPEVVVPEPDTAPPRPAASGAWREGDARHGGDGELRPGRRVRLVGNPHFGAIGRVRALLSEPRTFASALRLAAVEVVVAGDRRIVVPRANVEILDTPDAPGGAAARPAPAKREPDEEA